MKKLWEWNHSNRSQLLLIILEVFEQMAVVPISSSTSFLHLWRHRLLHELLLEGPPTLFLEHHSQDIWTFELLDVCLDYLFLDFPIGKCIVLRKTDGNAQNVTQRRKEKEKAMKLIEADVSCQGNDKRVKKWNNFFLTKKKREIKGRGLCKNPLHSLLDLLCLYACSEISPSSVCEG